MIALKLTKNELRNQQTRLSQLSRYLPTLQLKKALLQYEVNNVLLEIVAIKDEFVKIRAQVEPCSAFFLEKVSIDITQFADVEHVK